MLGDDSLPLPRADRQGYDAAPRGNAVAHAGRLPHSVGVKEPQVTEERIVGEAPREAEPRYRIRALHTADTVTVYQAYTPGIGLPAARDGRFPAAWKRDRMTWIKPRS